MGLRPQRALYFDATFLRFAKDLRGVPQVMVQLIRFLEAVKDFPPVHYLVMGEAAEKFLQPLGVPDSRMQRVKPLPLLGRFERFHGLGTTWIYRKLRGVALGILHPEPRTVVAYSIPQWVLIYDLIILEGSLSGEKAPLSRKWHYTRKLNRLTRVTASAAISEYTASRVRYFFPRMPDHQPQPLLLGVRQSLTSTSLVEDALKEGSLTTRALAETSASPALREHPLKPGHAIKLLYVGSFDARKNVGALIEAMPEMVQSALSSQPEPGLNGLRLELHLVGAITEERATRLRQLANAWPNSLSLHLHGLVPEKDLPDFYRTSHFFVLPSLFEGFGLPVMEAMAYGLPVFAFNHSSLPEIAGDAACLSETGDFMAWGKRLGRVLREPEDYQAWVVKALSRAQQFTEAAMRARYVAHWRHFIASTSATGIEVAAEKP